MKGKCWVSLMHSVSQGRNHSDTRSSFVYLGLPHCILRSQRHHIAQTIGPSPAAFYYIPGDYVKAMVTKISSTTKCRMETTQKAEWWEYLHTQSAEQVWGLQTARELCSAEWRWGRRHVFICKNQGYKHQEEMNTNSQHQSKSDLIEKISSNYWNDSYGMHLTNETCGPHDILKSLFKVIKGQNSVAAFPSTHFGE